MTPVILTYHKDQYGREWLTADEGRRVIPGDLTKTILENKPTNIAMLNGQRFKVTPKQKVGDLREVTIDWNAATTEGYRTGKQFVELEKLPMLTTMPFTQAPQTLLDWHKWLMVTEEKLPGQGCRELADRILTAQVFDFGDIDEARLMKENARAADLYNRGFLKLPYPVIVYRYTGEISGRVHLAAMDNGCVIQYGGTPKITDHYVWPLSLMIATRGTELRVEVPSRKLQQKRADRGRAPLPYITYVNAEHYYVAVRNTEAGGTHASPIPHLRRGHLRHYASGHTIWIKDMLVNCKSLDEVTPRKEYRIIRELQ